MLHRMHGERLRRRRRRVDVLIEGRSDQVRELAIEDVSRIHFQGGSILRTSRANPTRDAAALDSVVTVLSELGIGYLVLFYLGTSRLDGWWSPAGALVQPDLLATYMPWL